ncbi:NADP-dependent oxidoreductase [Hyphodiscus hymeniophilus]|uniref:NADP-dependent oxidoreductase n=1 Tax=Hyphodiscus hymeniophilus TaxID=353542 RepID=A0A9P6SPR8_9HELO|nr:NADP-dependent oxidoreductase [Hyphodiscus hymeniophilus]
MVENKSLILAKHPIALPIVGEDLVVKSAPFDLEQASPEGGLILKTNYVSYDPYQRGRSELSHLPFHHVRTNKPVKPNPASHSTGFVLGEPITNNALSTVVSSFNPRFKQGDVVIGNSSFSQYVLVPKARADKDTESAGFSVVSNPLGLDPKIFLGALGMPGLTAYSSFYEIGKPKKGEAIFISAASGAVGQIVGQLAKREGLVVIGSVGSEAKLEFIKETLGFDAGFNYKTEQPEQALKRLLKELGREGIDIYYDNVGGEQLDAALGALRNWGRVVCCGFISQTSKRPEDIYRLKNVQVIVGKRLNLRGFEVFDPDFGPKYSAEHQKNMQRWIKDGEIKVQMSVTEGIEQSAEGLVGMLKGENFGKAVLKIADL